MAGKAGRPPGARDKKKRPARSKNPAEIQLESVDEVVRVLNSPKNRANRAAMIAATNECRPSTQNLVHDVISLKYGGLTNAEIAERTGNSQAYIEQLPTRYPETWARGKALVQKNALEDLEAHQQIILTALTSYGMLAVETLAKILKDKNASASVRRRAAVDILNLVYARQTVREGGRDGQLQIPAALLIQNNITQQREDLGDYIIFDEDIEDAEVVSGDDPQGDPD